MFAAVWVASTWKIIHCVFTYSDYSGFMHMAAGLSVGLSGLAAGFAIGTSFHRILRKWNQHC